MAKVKKKKIKFFTPFSPNKQFWDLYTVPIYQTEVLLSKTFCGYKIFSKLINSIPNINAVSSTIGFDACPFEAKII